MSNFILICSLQLILMAFGREGGWQNYNFGRLRATVFDFVCFKGESGTPVLHLLLIAPLKHSSPSLRHVSYLAPRLSVTAWGTTFVSAMMDSRTTLNRCVSFVAHGCSQIRSSPLGCTSRLTSGLTEKTKWNMWKMDWRVLIPGFDGVAELIVKCCLLPFCWTIYCIYLSNWIFSWYHKNNKNTNNI